MLKPVSSRHHPLVARCRAVARGDDPTALLLDGLHLVTEALGAGLRVQQAVVSRSAGERADVRALAVRLEQLGVDLVSATDSVMAAASPVRSSSAIVAIVERPQASDERLYSGGDRPVVIACDVQDPGNVGAIARVAEAAGASGMIAAGRSADPFGWKALRGSMGSALRLPIASRANLGDAVIEARRHGCRIVATAPRDGQPLFGPNRVDLVGPIAVFIGGEGAGLASAIIDEADLRLTIPMEPPVESLNAAVTAALILYEARRQRC
jgi:TrmH family RNA methyltransferase